MKLVLLWLPSVVTYSNDICLGHIVECGSVPLLWTTGLLIKQRNMEYSKLVLLV